MEHTKPRLPVVLELKLSVNWSDSDIIPRNSKIFEFQKNFILILSSMKNAFYSSNLNVLASTQVDFLFKNVLNLVYGLTWSDSKIFLKIWFSLDSVFDSVYPYFFLFHKNVSDSNYRYLKSSDFKIKEP